MNLRLDGRVALVSGGASGIGRCCVTALREEGASVVVADSRQPDGFDGPGDSPARWTPTDVTSEAGVRRCVDDVVERFGRIDTVIGCAGISGPVGTPIARLDVADWDRVMEVNVRGNFLLAKHVLPHLENSDVGTMVFIASDSAFVAFDGMGAYSTSKAALLMLTKAIAVEHPSVRANALCPGIVDTPMSRADLGRAEGFADSALPVADPRDIASHALFLASPVSAPINATSLVADFGYLARPAAGALDFV
ncbi:SDR family NAD(P)-dependent oxidoreductase [Gordonia polyisoprenivorans]|uniref:SDR family NAD(P)-dependent oxidoreductase n=1 Tax=Gordonia polyisoprenivorans TaxID=84595 RepID=UPI00035FB9AB|nr:SDR family oxidoreductase [Gordonia polyisoprenivorans]